MSLRGGFAATIDRPRSALPGLALYSVRRAYNDNPDACLRRAAAEGFRVVGAPGGDRASMRLLKSRLDAYGIEAPVVILERSPAPQEQLEAAALVGARFVTIPSAPVFFSSSADGRFAWRQSVRSEDFQGFARQIPAFSALAEAAGLRLLYHFHDLDFVPMDDGLSPYDWMSTRVDPARIAFHLDTAWLAEARVDIPGLLQRLRGRIAVVDVKDVGPVQGDARRGGNMLPAGEGRLDLASSMQQFAAAGAEVFLIENEALDDEWLGVATALGNLRRLVVFSGDDHEKR